MPHNKKWFLISYDVRDDKRLRKVARHLEGYGERIQYSVFRCRLDRRSIERLKWELTRIMDTEDDLLVIGLCTHCAGSVTRRRKEERWEEKITSFEIV